MFAWVIDFSDNGTFAELILNFSYHTKQIWSIANDRNFAIHNFIAKKKKVEV